MSNSKYKFPFAKGKHECPKCRKTSFVRYKELPDYFGYCERKNACGYEFYANKVNLRDNCISFDLDNTVVKPKPDIIKKTKILDSDLCLNLINDQSSNFHKKMIDSGITPEHLKKWNVGSNKNGETLFFFKNQEGKFVNRKSGKYDERGKREKIEGVSSFFSLPQPKNETEKYALPVFGEHLIKEENKNIPVAVVESEKTAIIASFHYPEIVWVSCGSANGLSAGENSANDKISVLLGRQVWWMADADKAGRANSSINNLEKFFPNDYFIVDIFQEKEDGYDIADALLEGNRIKFFDSKIRENGEIDFILNQNFVVKQVFEENNDDDDEIIKLLPKDLPKADQIKMMTSIRRYGFYEHKNQYHFIERNNNYATRISNFTLKILFLIKSKTNPKRIVELKNFYNHTSIIDMDIESTVSLSRFNIITQGEGNYLFEGTMIHINKIKRKLLQEEKESKEIATLGWQKEEKFFAWANGIFADGKFKKIDKYGIIERSQKHYFIPVFSDIYKDSDADFENEKKFVFKKTQIQFKDWAKLFCDVYKERENGKVALMFVIASIFRDIVFKKIRSFPILNLFGVPRSGKSTCAMSLMYLFGEKQDPFMLGNAGTTKGFMRKFGQLNNALVWLDEYKNSIDKQKIEALKNIYDGVGYERALMTQDSRTKTTPVKSACILSGQELPTVEPALFSRTILLQYKKDKYSDEEIKLFDQLQSHELQGISEVVCQILNCREDVEKMFGDNYDNNFQFLRKSMGTENEMNDRILKNYTTLITMYDCIQNRLTLPFSKDELIKLCMDNIREQTNLIAKTNDVQKFWDMVQFLFETDKIKSGEDFKIVGGVLYVRLSKIYPLYTESYQRQFGHNGMDKISLIEYLKMSRGFKGLEKATRFDNAITSAYLFEVEQLDINLEKINFGSTENDNFQKKEIVKMEVVNNELFTGKKDNDSVPF